MLSFWLGLQPAIVNSICSKLNHTCSNRHKNDFCNNSKFGTTGYCCANLDASAVSTDI
jgi:hypothetical protein